MRASEKHRLSVLVKALLLGIAPALVVAPSTLANVNSGDALTSPASPIVLSAPSLAGEGSPTASIRASLVDVETLPLPNLDAVGPAKVQPPSIPQAEVPSAPPAQTPPLPTTSTPVPSGPVTSAPVPQLPGLSAPPTRPGPSSHEATSAQAVNAAGSTSSASSAATGGGAAHAGTNAGPRAPAAGRAAHSPRQGATARGDGHGGTRTSGKRSPALSSTSATPAATATRPLAAPGRASTRRKASSANPLDTIGRQIPFPVPVPDWSKPIILLLLALAIWFAARSRLAAVRARRLERQRATLLRDLEAMQATLVPVIAERVGELSVSVAYRPADGPAAGGDFYDLFVLEPGKVAIILGDIAGHGRSALNQAALTRYTLRAYMQAGLEPRAALALAGSVLAEPGEKQFATVVVGVHDSASGRLTYASAGHPPPISIGFDTPEPLDICCSAPICCDLPTGRRQTTISVPAGGEVCFFSDGLLEARQADGLLGRERLVEIVEELGPRATAAALLERVRAVAQATPDDMVACVISPTVGARALADQVEELEVDATALSDAHVRRFLQACGVPTADVASILAQASTIAEERGSALLRIERPRSGDATVTALALSERRGISSASRRAPARRRPAAA